MDVLIFYLECIWGMDYQYIKLTLGMIASVNDGLEYVPAL